MEDFYLLTVVTLDFTTSNKKLAYLCGLFAELLSTYIIATWKRGLLMESRRVVS
mgnify:FL=1